MWRWSIITFASSTADKRSGRRRFAATGLYPHRRFDSAELRRIAAPLAELRCVVKGSLTWCALWWCAPHAVCCIACSNVLVTLYPDLGRNDDDDLFVAEEPTTAQQFQAIKAGAGGDAGAGAQTGAGLRALPGSDQKAVRVEHRYVQGLFRCVSAFLPRLFCPASRMVWLVLLCRLLDRSVQALHLLSVVFETGHVPRLMKNVQKDVAVAFARMDFREFVVTPHGLTVSHQMVQVLMEELTELRPRAGEATKLASTLRARAGDFFSEGENLLCLVRRVGMDVLRTTSRSLTRCMAQAQQALCRADASDDKTDVLGALEESCENVKRAAKYWNVDRSLPALAKLCRGYCKHSYVVCRPVSHMQRARKYCCSLV